MNKSAINKTIECMRNSSTFTMDRVFKPRCNSPACLIGHVLYANMSTEDYQKISDEGYTEAEPLARTILDINDSDAGHLFTPEVYCGDGYNWMIEHNDDADTEITQEHAIACLERFRDTGKVDWRASK